VSGVANQGVAELIISSQSSEKRIESIPKQIVKYRINERAEGGVEDEYQSKIGDSGIFCSSGYHRGRHYLPPF